MAIRVPQSCSLSYSLNPLHTAEIQNGVYKSEIGNTTIKAVCNDGGGFSIYAVGYTDNELGKTVLSSTSGDEYDIITGTASSGNTSNWAMKLSSVPGVDSPSILSDTNGSFETYHTVPNTYTKVATQDSTTDFVIGSSINTTYAAYISKTQVAGTYEGKVKYVMIHPSSNPEPYIPVAIDCDPGTICYYPNSNDHDGTMGKQTTNDSNSTLVDGSAVTLLASNYSRLGYGFAGWNDKHDYTGNFYGPNETINAPVGVSENGISLYAVWVKSEGDLQDSTIATSVCGRLATAQPNGVTNLDSVSALTDKRDGQTYAIAKLADGNCWTIENLRLDATGSLFESLAQGYDSSFIGLAAPEAPSSFAGVTTANSLYTTDNDVDGKITISGISISNRIPRYSDINTGNRPINPTSNNTGSYTTEGMYSFGNYYTWAAANANTSEQFGYSPSPTSICPKGWRIPTGGIGGEFYSLNLVANSGLTDNSVGFRSFPNNFVYSGFIGSGTIYERGTNGYYWTSSPNGANYVYYMYFHKNYIYPGSSFDNGYYGRNVRCLLEAQ